MITLSDITLQVAYNLAKLTEGAASGGSATTLQDTVNLDVAKETFDGGTLWITSGTHIGKIKAITSFINRTLTFATLGAGATISAGDEYAVMDSLIPYEWIKRAVNNALRECKIYAEDTTLEGDGDTYKFTTPSGVNHITDIYLENQSETEYKYDQSHWEEEDGQIRFGNQHVPPDNYTIKIEYLTPHSALSDYDDEINWEVNEEWLKWRATVLLLHRVYRHYGEDERLKIPTDLEVAYNWSKRLRKFSKPRVKVRTAN